MLEIQRENRLDPTSFFSIDHELSAASRNIVTKNRDASYPPTSLQSGQAFIFRAIGNEASFKVRERKKNVHRQTAQRIGSIYRLRDRHQTDLVALKDLHQTCKIQ